MADVSATSDDPRTHEVGAYSGGHALVPILLGLSTPAVALILFAPELIGGALAVLNVYLFVLMAFALGVFAISVVYPGPLVSWGLDGRAGYLRVIRAGPLANTVTDIPVHKIDRARIEHRYDDDGYSWHEPQLILASGRILKLPPETTERDVAAINALLPRR